MRRRILSVISLFIAGGLISPARAQGVLTDLRWGNSTAASGGILRCDPGQALELSLEGEDASMQAVPLAMYPPEVTSSDSAVARVALSSSYAHIVNVRCVSDGEAWLTAETMGKYAHFGVLVGSAKGQSAMGKPRPGTASLQVSPREGGASVSHVSPAAPTQQPSSAASTVVSSASPQIKSATAAPGPIDRGDDPAVPATEDMETTAIQSGVSPVTDPGARQGGDLKRGWPVRKGESFEIGLNSTNGIASVLPARGLHPNVQHLVRWVQFGPASGALSPCLTVRTKFEKQPGLSIDRDWGTSGTIQRLAGSQQLALGVGYMFVETKNCPVGIYDLRLKVGWLPVGQTNGNQASIRQGLLTISVLP